MNMKTKKLTLVVSRHPRGFKQVDGVDLAYRVNKVVDSVDFMPGDFLSKADVEALCNRSDWNITVLPAQNITVLPAHEQ